MGGSGGEGTHQILHPQFIASLPTFSSWNRAASPNCRLQHPHKTVPISAIVSHSVVLPQLLACSLPRYNVQGSHTDCPLPQLALLLDVREDVGCLECSSGRLACKKQQQKQLDRTERAAHSGTAFPAPWIWPQR